jgi:hypothetical protein
MPSETVRARVWQSLIEAETRSAYFGRIASRLHAKERWAAFGVAIFSTGAFVSIVSKWQVPHLSEVTSLLSAVTGAYVGLLQKSKTAALASSLCRTWGEVQDDYEHLWHQLGQLEDGPASERWRAIEKLHYNADESATALGLLNHRLLRACQSQVLRLRGVKSDADTAT